MNTDKKIELYCQRGWCPVPWAHHPLEIKEEIRRIGFRPKMKSCFENCQRFVIDTVLDVQYHEGYVLSLIPIEHAWLTWRGKIIDLTVNDIQAYLKNNTYDWNQITKSIVRTGVFGPIDQRALAMCSDWYQVFERELSP